MTVFHYDKTFDGLLTAVFDAFARRTFPERLLAEGEPEPLFTAESYTVATDTARSGRVWRALERKAGRQTCNMTLNVWLSEELGSDELIFRFLCKMFAADSDISADFGDADVLAMHGLGLKVSREGEHVRQFVRFQKAADGSYFAPIAPKYNALPLAVSYFCDRFGDQRWLVYDTKRRYGYLYDLHTAVEVTLDDDAHLLDGKLGDDIRAQDEKLFQTMWHDYFKALTIKERINPKLQLQHMPKRFWKYLPEMQ
ncbi:TIGR03915 family putative DNA repair protein [Alistipes sp. OttesenSCG-928-B03]|nr:TIGR03915 family putative DNA repair protein [Alistipes sp. OttesenSCG-928-B03]